MPFEANTGQHDARVAFVASTASGNATLSIVFFSHQSTPVRKSTRSSASQSTMSCVKNVDGKSSVGYSFFVRGGR